jgi:hypothetical protein
MPMHTPYRNPVAEFTLWLVWTFARYVFWFSRIVRRIATLVYPLAELAAHAARWVAQRTAWLGRRVAASTRDLSERPDEDTWSPLEAIVYSAMAGLAVAIVVLVAIP